MSEQQPGKCPNPPLGSRLHQDQAMLGKANKALENVVPLTPVLHLEPLGPSSHHFLQLH